MSMCVALSISNARSVSASDAIILPLPIDDNQTIYSNQEITLSVPDPDDQDIVSPNVILDDLLILQVRLNNLVLSDGQLGYRMGDSACLYLEDFARALEFPIVFDDETGLAEGWFIDERNTFKLDTAQSRVLVGNNDSALKRDDLIVFDDGPCVSFAALTRWFPLNVSIDFEDAIVFVESLRPLPVEQRLAREKRRAGLDRLAIHKDSSPVYKPTYKLVDMPVVDLFLDGSIGKTSSNSAVEANTGYELYATGDFLKLSGEVAISGTTEDPLSNVRVKLGRKDPEGKSFGGLGLTEFAVGDVSTVQTPLSAQNELGRGVLLSTYLLDQPDEFDRITLRGALLDGWEVELYRNDILLDFRVPQSAGRFEFIDVPLQFGRNRFVLVFYGPEGQRREEVKEIYVGTEMLTPGDVRFRTVVNQQDRNLFGTQALSQDPDAGSLRAISQIDVGILKTLSMGANFAALSLDGARKYYGGGTLTSSFNAFAVRLDATVDAAGGYALGGATQGRIGPINLFGRHEYFSAFISERVSVVGDDFLKDRSQVRLDTIVPLLPGFGLPFSLEARRERRLSGAEEIAFSSRASASVGNFSTTNNLDVTLLRDEFNDQQEAAFGSFLFNFFASPVFLRGDIAYDIIPTKRLTNVSLTGEWDVREDLNFRLTGLHDLTSDQSTATTSLSKRFRHVSLAANSSYSTDKTYEFGLALNFSLGHNPLDNRWEVSSDKRGEFGAVVANACIDEDQDDLCTIADTPLDAASFLINGQRTPFETNAKGKAFLPTIPIYSDTHLGVDLGSVQDPYIVPSKNNVRLITRPGPVPQFDFTFLQTGEVDGTVFVQRTNGKIRGAADVLLELIDGNGNVALSTKSEFDGFFLFEKVPLGAYTLQISAEQIDRLGFLEPPTKSVLLNIDKSLAAGNEFFLTKASIPALRAARIETRELSQTP